MKSAAVLLLCLTLFGCGSDVEQPSPSTGCSGTTFDCAAGCGSDYFPAQAACVDGAWECPEGTVDPSDCPANTCWGIPLPCEVCGPEGRACEPTPTCVAGCAGGAVCLVCPPGGGITIIGACACQCNAGTYQCSPAPDCCEQDIDCGDEQYVPCVNQVCKQPVAGQCWSDAECPVGSVCAGAEVCPCGQDCTVEDQPGDCVAPP